jgi:hypothetical protein
VPELTLDRAEHKQFFGSRVNNERNVFGKRCRKKIVKILFLLAKGEKSRSTAQLAALFFYCRSSENEHLRPAIPPGIALALCMINELGPRLEGGKLTPIPFNIPENWRAR